MILLRQYQIEAIEAVRTFAREGKLRSIINLPCGLGKTVTAMTMVTSALRLGNRALFICHREELAQQSADTFRAIAPEYADRVGVVKAERDERDKQLVIASAQTLCIQKRLDRTLHNGLPDFALVIVDECHHASAPSWRRILDALPIDAAVVGLTATVERGDSASLSDVFPDGIVYSVPLLVAIRDGYLVPFVPCPVRIDGLDLDGVGTVAGDFNQGQLGEAMEEEHVVAATAQAIIDHAHERRSVVFTVTVAQAEKTCAALAPLGIVARTVHAETPTDERKAVLRDFRAGKIQVIANCAILTEGWDEPSANCIVLARPTKSKTLFIQMLGRGLRLFPGKKDCLVIDLMGATARHSPIQAAALIDEMEREAQALRMHNAGCAPPCDAPRCRCWCHKLHDGAQGMLRPDWTPPDWAHWVDLGDGAIASSTPGLNVIVWPDGPQDESDDKANVWRCTAWRKGKGRLDMTPAPVWLDLARGIGEDVLRRAGGAKIAKKDAGWRERPASEGQISALRKWNAIKPDLDVLNLTRGDAADLLTKAISGMQWKKLRKGRDSSRVLAFSDAAELDAIVEADEWKPKAEEEPPF